MNDSDNTNANTPKLKYEQSSVSDTKPVLARLTPSMTREQMRENLENALRKSGFTLESDRAKETE